MRTLSLRIASGLMLGLATTLLAADWIMAWLVRLDRVGLAQLLEKRYPDLAERLLTVVQLEAEGPPSSFVPLLRAETEEMLADIDPEEACPLASEGKVWLRTLGVWMALGIGLCFVPGFLPFTGRFFSAWATPLVPLHIEWTQADQYVLRGGTCVVEAKCDLLDERVEIPAEIELVREDESGGSNVLPMKSVGNGRFAATLEKVEQPLRCRARVREAVSEIMTVHVIDAPAFRGIPTLEVTPPKYTGRDPKVHSFDKPIDETIVRYSGLRVQFALDRMPVQASVHIRPLHASKTGALGSWIVPVQWHSATMMGFAEEIAAAPGSFQAELVLELEHGVKATLPFGTWAAHEDSAPRFVQPLRLRGSGPSLTPSRDYRIATDDALKLQTVVDDDEEIEQVWFEYCINDRSPRLEKWLAGGGKKKLVIDEWLPLPKSLKADDRVQFRVHVGDNRRLKKGEARTTSAGLHLPGADLLPQVTIEPTTSARGDAWISLRVDSSVKDFFKEQVQAQTDEIRDIILAIREKVVSEADDVQKIHRKIHQQTALTPEQLEQAKKLRDLNREISADLLAAADRFGKDPELARLAEHFLDIAESDLLKSAEALKSFSAKDRALPDAEKDLLAAHEALTQAKKKLDRMLDWNKLLAQDRLDQFQIEKLAKRQDELAKRLQKLLDDESRNEPETAKEIEAIRNEQAKLAQETERLQGESRLVQESMEAEQRKRAEELVKEAQALAAEQRAMREAGSEKWSPELQERLAKLAKRQADLARRVQPFAEKNQGPDVKPAGAAADALKKPSLEDAIGQQQEHEKRLNAWLDKLAPGDSANALYDQIMQLVKKQRKIRNDLEQLVKESGDLDFATLQKRLEDLANRQKEMPSAIAKLAVDVKQQDAQKAAEATTRRAAEQMARENAAGAPEAHDLMKKAESELQALANALPKTVPVDRKNIKDPELRAKVEIIDAFAREQEKLRAETQQLRTEATKASAGSGKSPLADKADKLAAELMELAQKAKDPETKAIAKESAEAAMTAKKAMEASQAMKAKGEPDEARKMDESAEKQLELAVKKLGNLPQDPAMKNMPKDKELQTAKALKEGSNQMRLAEKNLPGQPKNAQNSMQAAAKSLQKASQQASMQASRSVPSAARNAPKMPSAASGTFPGSLPKNAKLESFQGKAWGELSGELRTQMLQDVRARFGEDYADMIQQYFRSLSESPRKQ